MGYMVPTGKIFRYKNQWFKKNSFYEGETLTGNKFCIRFSRGSLKNLVALRVRDFPREKDNCIFGEI